MPNNKDKTKMTVPSWRDADYRGFLFVVHCDFGLLLLHCTRKKNKPPHWQLPGGHVDEAEFVAAAQQTTDPNEQLLLAAKAGAARELYEETGIDVMRQLERLQPALLQHDNSNNDSLPNLYKSRLFFHLSVTDADFPATGNVAPMATTAAAQHLRLALSVEHAGFTFQPEPAEAVVMLQHHSGGKCAQALQMAQQQQQSTRDVAADLLLPPPPPPKNETWKCCGFFGSSS